MRKYVEFKDCKLISQVQNVKSRGVIKIFI
jgi:hypothetical protein